MTAQIPIDDLNKLLDQAAKMPPHQRTGFLREAVAYIESLETQAAYNNFIPFVQKLWPPFVNGPHHKFMAKTFERIVRGEEVRMIVNIAPRHSKSLLASQYFPAWFLGHFPEKKVIQVCHTADLAVEFGRKVRNLIATPEYRLVFPTTRIANDSAAAGAWKTSSQGEYFAVGVGGALAGRGGDLIIVDDPHSEQEAKQGDPSVFDKVYEWWQTGARQRVQPHASIIVVQTRWSKRDLTGRLVHNMITNPAADQWEVVEFPAILPSGKPLWGEYWKLDQLLKIKNSIDSRYWNAQYMQNPTSEEGALIKREWWKWWEQDKPPKVDYIIASLDTASETKTHSDYTVLMVWGVFYVSPDGHTVVDSTDLDAIPSLILLDLKRERVEFPELKQLVKETIDEYAPDSFIVEKKNSGIALYQELRRTGLAVEEYTPHRGTGDKRARVNSVSDIVKNGICWLPRKRWAEDMVEECAAFPAGDHDDQVDTLFLALHRFRSGGFLRLPTDMVEEDTDLGEESNDYAYY